MFPFRITLIVAFLIKMCCLPRWWLKKCMRCIFLTIHLFPLNESSLLWSNQINWEWKLKIIWLIYLQKNFQDINKGRGQFAFCCCAWAVGLLLWTSNTFFRVSFWMKNEELKMHQHSTVSTGQLGTAAAGKVLSNSHAMFSKDVWLVSRKFEVNYREQTSCYCK